MKNTLISLITAVTLTAGTMLVPVTASAFDTPQPDTGEAGGISAGGEWFIYASKTGTSRNSTAITDASEKGIAEVTGSAGMSGQFQFDLSTMNDNSATDDSKVIKSAKLRLTPVVSRSGIKHNLYAINNDFTTTDGKRPITQFDVPRGSNNDLNKDTNVTSLTADDLTEYPSALSAWQTDIDITGEAVTADDMISFSIEYASGNTEKTEYATSNIAQNGRLNGGAVPLLYSDGATEYSKWVYPQIIFEYTDSAVYTGAYADFISAYNTLGTGKVTEDSGITLSDAENGSEITLEMYGSTSSPIKADGQSLVLNNEYAGNAPSADVILTVTKTDGEETAVYSRVVTVPAEYTPSNIITFDSSKNPKGEISVTSDGTVYTDGTAYAKQGGAFSIDVGANTGYTAATTVKTADGEELFPENGLYTMPDCDVEVSVEYSKNTYGTTRIAAVNSISVKSSGDKQGHSESAQNIVIGAGRITFVKFDLSSYNAGLITDADISFNAWNTANTKAVFYVPNNEWDENTFSKNFCLDGTDSTNLTAFAYTDENGDEAVISLLNGTDIASLIIPDSDDASSASNGILKDYYIGSTGTNKTAAFSVTETVKTALGRSSDNVVTLMLYSAGSGNDANSVMYAGTLSTRPSLTVTESAANLADDELITGISTVEELEVFAAIVNGGNSYSEKTVTLLKDIDLSEIYSKDGSSWTPIGTPDAGGAKPFDGTFDGGNNSITGLYINSDSTMCGLFGLVTGTVQNLTVSGEINGSSVIGGIAASCSGSITNCSSGVNINAQREAGGIVGTLGGVISDCHNTGNITIENKETYAGGIAAHCYGTVTNCTNSGTISNGTDGFRNKLGGIVGYLDNGSVNGCINSGNVTSEAETASYTGDTTQNYIGGIVGYSSYGTITDCKNNGDVYNAVDYAGGIAGALQNGDTVSGCTNSGAVTGTDYVGGIVGYNGNSAVSECENTAKVNGTGESTGGVIGYLSTGSVAYCTYDKELNSTLDIVGVNSAGSIISPAFSVIYDGKTATVTAAQPGTYTLIFATYDAQQILTGTEIQTVIFEAVGEKTVSPQKLDTTGASSVKVMMWNGLDTMKPMSKSAVN